jgi:hypothetical protein
MTLANALDDTAIIRPLVLRRLLAYGRTKASRVLVSIMASRYMRIVYKICVREDLRITDGTVDFVETIERVLEQRFVIRCREPAVTKAMPIRRIERLFERDDGSTTVKRRSAQCLATPRH